MILNCRCNCTKLLASFIICNAAISLSVAEQASDIDQIHDIPSSCTAVANENIDLQAMLSLDALKPCTIFLNIKGGSDVDKKLQIWEIQTRVNKYIQPILLLNVIDHQ